MGMASISDGRLSSLSEGDFLDCYLCYVQNGSLVYVHAPVCGTYCRSFCLCSGMRRCLDEANGLLHAKRKRLEQTPPDKWRRKLWV